MNKSKQEKRRRNPAYNVALVGIMAATVECGKLALAVLPNIEVVTILLALYGYVFGIYGIAAAFIFVSIEPLIYGFGTWLPAYFIHWPLVAIVFMLLGKAKMKNRWVITAVAILLTFFFGVLTSIFDVGLLSGNFDRFFYRFGVYYARGIVFYAIQIACNTVLFSLCFRFFADKLSMMRNRFFK
jgi:hypothetical protein